MKDNKELREILGEMLSLNKCRLDCLTSLIMALMVVRTTNLAKLAMMIKGAVLPKSCMRRLQHFFAEVPFDYDQLAKGLLRLMFTETEGLNIAVDRTNWQFGKMNINILTLAIAHSSGAAIPIFWMLLDKKGNSNTPERIEIFQRFLGIVDKKRIKSFLADREFIGSDWFRYLEEQGIPYLIRIRENTVTVNSKGKKIQLKRMFADLDVNKSRKLRKMRRIWGLQVYLCALRLPTGELLILASNVKFVQSMKLYGRRWEIETLFQCLKGRGFNFEDSRITNPERVSRMVAVLALAFVWAVKVGEWCNDNVRKLKTKKHGRLEKSIFRYGLDTLHQAILEVRFEEFWTTFLHLLYPKEIEVAAGI